MRNPSLHHRARHGAGSRPGRLRQLWVVLALLASWSAWAAPAPVTVAIGKGRLAGQSDGSGAVFLGIPFAAPPTGALRWRPPQDVAAWSGVRDATHAPAACAQNDYGWNRADAMHSSEDCLYLNLKTPNLHPKQPLPVLVWIHGGSNRAGSAADIDRIRLAHAGIVVVSVQYRLGVFGFLSLPALSAEQGGHSGNYGLMDQLAALAWVQREIGRFGGDPRRVTIAGQSAGGMDVGLLALEAGDRQLFAGAWSTGGTPGFGQSARSLAQNEALGTQLEQRLHVDDLEQLRQAPPKALLAADLQLHSDAITDDSYLWLQAVVDGKVVTEPPASLLADVPATAIPYVLTTNRIELQVPGGAAKIERRLHQVFGDRYTEAAHHYGVGALARADADPGYGTLAERIGTDTDFRCAGNHVLAHYAAHGAPAWRAQFSFQPSHHSAELPYLYEGKPLNAAHPAVSPQAYFINFIKTGDPDGAGLPPWPRYMPDTGAHVDMGPDGVHAGTHLGGSICDLFDGV
ncbi:carboxylesterase/lipase family protein [Rhodanobacter caeni]|uniref:Carboxylic ester hydrolase n=1 Tax=Rhodanobacter caeni TaxID=657654 RepID=A0ABN0UHD4_9GAMM